MADDAESRKGAGGPGLPSGDGHDAVGFADPHEVARVWQQIELLVERLEGFQDAHDGVAVVDVQLMTKAEKDALICSSRLRGLSPEAIHSVYGDQIGKPDTIRKCRNEHGLSKYGLPLPRADERRAA